MQEIESKSNPEEMAEYLYLIIKGLTKNGELDSKALESLADLITELSNRQKVEEACGE